MEVNELAIYGPKLNRSTRGGFFMVIFNLLCHTVANMSLNTANILGIDFGTTRIGVAIARGPLAEPLTIVTANETAVDRLLEICEQKQVTQIIAGISEGLMAEQTRLFMEQLTAKTGLPLVYVDETLSSKEMTNKLREAGNNRALSGPIDHYVAAQLLQDWLDDHVEEAAPNPQSN